MKLALDKLHPEKIPVLWGTNNPFNAGLKCLIKCHPNLHFLIFNKNIKHHITDQRTPQECMVLISETLRLTLCTEVTRVAAFIHPKEIFNNP